MAEREVARFECAGDVRVMRLGEQDGRVVVREDLSGPSVIVAYGEEERSLFVTLSTGATSRLLGAIGASGEERSLRDYLASEQHDISDLMDLCDRQGIPYSFASLGSGGEAVWRPAAC